MCYQSGTPTCAVSWHCCGTAQSSTRCQCSQWSPLSFPNGPCNVYCDKCKSSHRTWPARKQSCDKIFYDILHHNDKTKPKGWRSSKLEEVDLSMFCRLCACFHHLPLQVLRFCCIMTFDTYFSIEKTPVTLIFNTCAPVVFQHVSNYCQAQAAKPCQNPQRCSHPQVQIVLDTPHCWKGNQCDLKWQDPNHALDPHFLPFPSFVSLCVFWIRIQFT